VKLLTEQKWIIELFGAGTAPKRFEELRWNFAKVGETKG
jgi:hypothetical protein